MPIDWNYPQVRKGLAGAIDKFIGPGATKSEILLQTIPVIIAAVVAPLYALYSVKYWSLIQYLICSLLAFDTIGGVITNATSSAKRWYHRKGQGFKQHLGFIFIHLFHLLLVAWLFIGFDIKWFLVTSVYLVIASITILKTSLYLQRPIALLMFTIGLLISLYVLPEIKGLEWFLPLFYLKLLVGHLPKEEPYRPT